MVQRQATAGELHRGGHAVGCDAVGAIGHEWSWCRRTCSNGEATTSRLRAFADVVIGGARRKDAEVRHENVLKSRIEQARDRLVRAGHLEAGPRRAAAPACVDSTAVVEEQR